MLHPVAARAAPRDILAGDFANEPPAYSQSKDYPQIDTEMTLGLLSATGNTESRSVNFDIATSIDYWRWHHSLEFDAFQASENGDETAERYTGRWQSDYRFSTLGYVFGTGRYTHDRFGSYQQRGSLIAGLGRQLFDNDSMKARLQGGLGARVSEQQQTDRRTNEAVFSVRGTYAWQFSQTSQFHQVLEIRAGSDNTVTRSTTRIKSKLTEDLSWVIAYKILHNSDVPKGLDKTDTYTTVSIQYGF